jgi:hypothetical protein
MKFRREVIPLKVTSTPYVLIPYLPKWRTFELLRWMQNLHHSTWDHEILYAGRSSKDEELLIRSFLSETKNTIMAAV